MFIGIYISYVLLVDGDVGVSVWPGLLVPQTHSMAKLVKNDAVNPTADGQVEILEATSTTDVAAAVTPTPYVDVVIFCCFQ